MILANNISDNITIFLLHNGEHISFKALRNKHTLYFVGFKSNKYILHKKCDIRLSIQKSVKNIFYELLIIINSLSLYNRFIYSLSPSLYKSLQRSIFIFSELLHFSSIFFSMFSSIK